MARSNRVAGNAGRGCHCALSGGSWRPRLCENRLCRVPYCSESNQFKNSLDFGPIERHREIGSLEQPSGYHFTNSWLVGADEFA